MPIVAQFFGISIKIFFNDHLPPHFHAIYAEYNGLFHIETLEMIEGDMPGRAISLIREWATEHKAELLQMWQTKEFKKIEGLQ